MFYLLPEAVRGSLAINTLVDPILPELTKHFIVYHQTGGRVNRKMDNYFSADWFPTPAVADIFKRAKIVVGRAGANTVTYLSYFGIPSILIPLPISGGGGAVGKRRFVSRNRFGYST